jgi:hypothetical protein
MALWEELKAGQARWRRLTAYLKFEHAVVLVLTALISVIIVAAVWKLALKIIFGLVLADSFDLSDLAAFQSVFGMIFTVIIAVEFKRTLLLVSQRTDSIVQVRAVILIALLDGLEHRVRTPKLVHVHEGPGGVAALEIIDGRGLRHTLSV